MGASDERQQTGAECGDQAGAFGLDTGIPHTLQEQVDVLRLQNETLANLYVAGFQLHATLQTDRVVSAISDILAGLIGASSYAIFLSENGTKTLRLVAGEGVHDRFPTGEIEVGEGLEGRVAETGDAEFGKMDEPAKLTVCVPLVLDGDLVGVIGIYELLSQKATGLNSIDHELLNLLASQAPCALVCSKLYGQK